MAMLIKYCEVCGERVSPEDLERASAVLYKELAYCRKCKAQVLPLIEQEKQAQKPKKSMGPATGKIATASTIIKPPSSAVRRPQSTIQAKTISSERRKPSIQNNNSLMLFLGAGSVLLVILILFFILSSNKENPNSNGENPLSKEDPPKKDPINKDPINKDPINKDPINKDPINKDPINKDPLQGELAQLTKSLSEIQDLEYALAKEKIQELKQKFTSEKALSAIDLAYEEISKKHQTEAQEEYNRRKDKVDKILEKAIKSATPTYAKTKFNEAEQIWNSFPKKYEDTSYWEEKDKELARIQRERESKIGEKKQENSNPKDDKNVKLTPKEGKWDLNQETGIISGQSEKNPGLLEVGEHLEGKEFSFALEVKSEKGAPVIHFHFPEKKDAKHLTLNFNNPPEENWQKVNVQFNGKLYTIQIDGGEEQTFDPIKEKCSTSGKIFLGCLPESLVHYRNLNFKLE